MYQVDYNGFTMFIGERTGKWICFNNPYISDATKIEMRFDLEEIETTGLLRDKLITIDDISEQKECQDRLALLIIVTTNTCNMSCEYCYMSAKNQTTTKEGMIRSEKIIEIIDTFSREFSSDSFQVLFQGGEPMLSFSEIKMAVEHYKQKGAKYVFSIQSNGTLFHKDSIDSIKELGIQISISKDGIEEKSTQLREGGKTSARKAMAHGEDLMREKQLGYGVIAVVGNNNVSSMYEYALELIRSGVHSFSFNPFYSIGRGRQLIENYPSIIEYTHIMKELFSMLYQKNMQEGYLELNKYHENNLFLLWKRIFKREYALSCCNKAPCDAASKTFTVDWNGDVYPCTYFMMPAREEHKLGNIVNLKHVMSNGRNSIVKKRCSSMLHKCSCCPYEKICGGGGCSGAIYNATSILGESHYCDYYKEIIPYMITTTMQLSGKTLMANF